MKCILQCCEYMVQMSNLQSNKAYGYIFLTVLGHQEAQFSSMALSDSTPYLKQMMPFDIVAET